MQLIHYLFSLSLSLFISFHHSIYELLMIQLIYKHHYFQILVKGSLTKLSTLSTFFFVSLLSVPLSTNLIHKDSIHMRCSSFVFIYL
ncbi:uncharacterized protein BX663DRAFT_519881 [Cokeromyces recurvatus]|uniref:uncharacterized protein n=1 Tax=Cokeromyces recurvatus TaxID=90255 RepID=UPI00221FDFCD|nr:uncharacterized protein BX663DRAFT_519881 [Cokeromyces recurvatus]KAI7899900.1 hypothetical protein BX663DRAFT_519881 [Cokeromyces recurvatus]